MFLHARVFLIYHSQLTKRHILCLQIRDFFFKVKPQLCNYNPIGRRHVAFLRTMEMLNIYFYLCCCFKFVWLHFSASCGDSAVLWLGLSTKKNTRTGL